jgi:hypothetical protein
MTFDTLPCTRLLEHALEALTGAPQLKKPARISDGKPASPQPVEQVLRSEILTMRSASPQGSASGGFLHQFLKAGGTVGLRTGHRL